MPLSKTIRWPLIATAALLVFFLAPLTLIMAGNLGGGIIDLVLNRKPVISELVGSYKLQVPWGSSYLDIKADGTFHEVIAENGKKSRDIVGHWEAQNGENFLAVNFRPFGMVWDDDHKRETSIYGINFYKPHLGSTYGMIDDDLGESYKRQQ